jgi:general secretion pathway protein D
MRQLLLLLFLLFATNNLEAQTIADKKAMMNQSNNDFDAGTSGLLKEVNQEIEENRTLLRELYQQADELYEYNANENLFEDLLEKIKRVRKSIRDIQKEWQLAMAEKGKDEEYSLWNTPETTLGQLVMDYGSTNFVYLIPPAIGAMKISINSYLPVPRESWEEMLHLILESNGVGMKTLNPYLRELILMKENHSNVQHITSNRKDLSFYPDNIRICYVLRSSTMDPKEALQLLERFANNDSTTFYTLGRQILIFSKPSTVLEILKVYDFMESDVHEKEYKVVTLNKMNAEEVEKILSSIFHGGDLSSNSSSYGPLTTLKTIALKSHGKSLFLMGAKDEVSKAENIIHELEEQMASSRDKTVFSYTCKYSSAEELAKVLKKIYPLMIRGEVSRSGGTLEEHLLASTSARFLNNDTEQTNSEQDNNFIVDPKTSSILMVIEKEAVSQLNSLLAKLDVPKKMVRIEVLLVEKKIKDSNHLGLNLLKMGNQSTNTDSRGLRWNNSTTDGSAGILSFLLSRKKSASIPAFDLAYRFLLHNEDVQVNASPSVVTVNQTPAKIEIVEEISINTGVALQTDNNNNNVLKDSFSRAKYGIVIEVTPNIHMKGDDASEDELNYVTLSSDILFDTVSPDANRQPNVNQRHIKNEVRIADGETVIIGGLRRKNISDIKEKIPFLGELPGVGKLFGTTDMADEKTEMFIFITPKIISDPKMDFERIQREELKRRPGDVPAFIASLEEAKQFEKERLMEKTFKLLFGRPDSAPQTQGEYDGR